MNPFKSSIHLVGELFLTSSYWFSDCFRSIFSRIAFGKLRARVEVSKEEHHYFNSQYVEYFAISNDMHWVEVSHVYNNDGCFYVIINHGQRDSEGKTGFILSDKMVMIDGQCVTIGNNF